jgi:YggT family protein
MLAQLISGIFDLLNLLLIIRVLISWIPHDRYHPVVAFLYQSTDPLLRPFQNMIPRSVGIDFSPIFAFVFLGILRQVIFRIL